MNLTRQLITEARVTALELLARRLIIDAVLKAHDPARAIGAGCSRPSIRPNQHTERRLSLTANLAFGIRSAPPEALRRSFCFSAVRASVTEQGRNAWSRKFSI
jgi:hypothetical protein